MCIYSFQILLPFRLLQNTEQSSGHHLVMWTHLGQPESRDPDHTCSRAGLHSVPWGTASASGSYSCPIFPITTGLLPPGQSTGPDPSQRERGSCYSQISEYPRCFLPPFPPKGKGKNAPVTSVSLRHLPGVSPALHPWTLNIVVQEGQRRPGVRR